MGWSARSRDRADAQGRSDDGAGSEESIGKQPAGGRARAASGYWFREKNRNFFGEAPEELRPWAIKRERSPGCRCPALLIDELGQPIWPAIQTGNPLRKSILPNRSTADLAGVFERRGGMALTG